MRVIISEKRESIFYKIKKYVPLNRHFVFLDFIVNQVYFYLTMVPFLI